MASPRQEGQGGAAPSLGVISSNSWPQPVQRNSYMGMAISRNRKAYRSGWPSMSGLMIMTFSNK